MAYAPLVTGLLAGALAGALMLGTGMVRERGASHPAPDFWPAFCAGVDLVLAALIATAIWKGTAQ